MEYRDLHEVFTISGIPKYTYVKPQEYNKIITSLKTPGRGLVIEGPSGIGKTTTLIKVLDDLKIPYTKLESRKSEDQEIIGALPTFKNPGVVLIDDFHRLPDALKQHIADLMKVLADTQDPSNKVVAVGINKAGDQLIAFGRDLNDRIDTVRFETNPDAKVSELIEKGELELNILLNSKPAIIKEVRGSFHLAQLLCHETCLIGDVLKTCDTPTVVPVSIEVTREKVFDNQARSFSPVARKFATGPRFRREGRAPYLHLLYWLAMANDWSLDIDQALAQHPELKGSVSQIVDKGYLEDFIKKNQDIAELISYSSKTNVLSIEDPKLLFYLRNLIWKNFARQIGFINIQFASRYDVALSFAGEDRDVAAVMFEYLQSAECEVFYDKNEQHLIAASDVEEYLSRIYQTEARFVVAILGPAYPRKIWTKFESDQFKERFGEGAVIPVWDARNPPSFFDATFKVGGFFFDREQGDLDGQVAAIGDNVLAKIKEERILSAEASKAVIDEE